ncbi:hypothetical protein HWV62_13247 [Athelia sp. TMB]|nr:hypothetical protein HWV62_13247 [Athelia sp. TMB]
MDFCRGLFEGHISAVCSGDGHQQHNLAFAYCNLNGSRFYRPPSYRLIQHICCIDSWSTTLHFFSVSFATVLSYSCRTIVEEEDARTDAKVATLKSCGVEILGLATLQLVEVWGGSFNSAVSPANGGSARTSIDQPSSALARRPPALARAPLPPPRARPTGGADAERREDVWEDVLPQRAPRQYHRVPRLLLRLLRDGEDLDPPRTANAPRADWLPAPAVPARGPPTLAEANTPALRLPILGITPTFTLRLKAWRSIDTRLLALGGRVRALGKYGAGNRGVTGFVEVRLEWTRGRIREIGHGGGRAEPAVDDEPADGGEWVVRPLAPRNGDDEGEESGDERYSEDS